MSIDQITPRPCARPRRGLRVIPLLLAAAFSHAYADPVEGPAGVAGSNGTTPGSAGTAGGAAPTFTFAADATLPNTADGKFALEIHGGSGGAGGNGAPGGAAGAGGRGGDTDVLVLGSPAWDSAMSTYSYVRGGSGGAAGLPGSGGQPALGGAGGNARVVSDIGTNSSTAGLLTTAYAAGGSGGDGSAGGGNGGASTAQVTARGGPGTNLESSARTYGGLGGTALQQGNGGSGGNSVASNASTAGSGGKVVLTSEANGGGGGNGRGAGQRGGTGGTASATLQARVGNAITEATVSAVGGSGGFGLAGADGATGGAAVLRDAADVVTYGTLQLTHIAEGGQGGTSDRGRAGAGGLGDSSLTLTDRHASQATVQVIGRGGKGGDASAIGGTTNAGGHGFARADVTANAPLTLEATADGGRGGDARYWGRDARTNGGAGGRADASSIGHGAAAVTVKARATGGNGGEGTFKGQRGGNGGTAFANAAGHSAEGNVDVVAEAKGGDGAWGYNNASGGDGGNVSLVDSVTGTTSGALTLTQTATAGNGGNGNMAWGTTEQYSGGNGGTATSRLTLTDRGAASVDAVVGAYGGYAGSGKTPGKGGDAEAALSLRALAAGASASGTVTAEASGIANARASVEAARRAVAEASVFSSSSATRDNPAEAIARAVSAGSARALAKGSWKYAGEAPGVRAEAVGGNLGAYAEAHSSGKLVDVSASSSATGAASNSAFARIGYADLGTVRADSISMGADNIRVHTASQGSVDVRPDRFNSWSTRSDANVGGAVADTGRWIDSSGNYSYATAAPDGATLATALAAAPEVAAALARGEAVGVGAMGMRYSSYETIMVTAISSANFQFSTSAPGYLTLGLFDPVGAGDRSADVELTISNHGTQIFRHWFGTLADAQLFFSDHALGLAPLGAGEQDLLVTARFWLGESGAFSFHYALGVSPVPETQTWLLMLMGSVFVFRAGRRKG